MPLHLPQTDDTSVNQVEIKAFVELLTTGLLELHETTQSLEHALSAVIEHNQDMGSDTLQALQSLDYARQYAKDLHAIVDSFGDQLAWSSGAEVTPQALAEKVDMKGTLSPLFGTAAPTASQDQDVWF